MNGNSDTTHFLEFCSYSDQRGFGRIPCRPASECPFGFVSDLSFSHFALLVSDRFPRLRVGLGMGIAQIRDRYPWICST